MFDEAAQAIETTFRESEKMPSLKHSYICSQILRQLLANEEIQPLPELTLDIENGLTPDISVYRKTDIRIDPLEDFSKFGQMPVLAIKVISASQTVQQLREKSKIMRNAGILAVWTVEPYLRSVLVNDANGERVLREETIESENITVDFANVFR